MSTVALALMFVAIGLVITVFVLISRRFILGRFLRWRLNKIREWGKIIDRITARLGEPSPAEKHDLEVVGVWTRSALEDALMSRVDLMSGNSRIPLIKTFQRSRLLNLCIAELESNNVWKRRKAADMLGRAAGRDYARYLIDALKDTDTSVRVIAARGLGKMGIQVAASPMVEQFMKLKENECRVVVDALINLGYSALMPLNRALLHNMEQVRYFAALCISHICEEGRCQLIVMRKMPRRRATDVPVRSPDRLADHLLKLTWDDSPRIRRAVLGALASLGVKRAASRVERMLAGDSDPTVRAAAAEAMVLLARSESANVMLNALDDEDWDVQCAASQSLIALGAPWVGRIGRPPHDSDNMLAWREEIVTGVKTWI